MTKFTNSNNIFRHCVDILLKLSYNVKRVFSHSRNALASMPRIILFILLFLVAMLMSAFPANSSDLQREESESLSVMELSLNGGFIGEGEFCLSVESNGEFCGLLVYLRYDPECFEFLGVRDREADAKDFCVSYVHTTGEIRVLLDGAQNASAGNVVTLDFRLMKEHGDRGATFHASAPTGGAYRFENGKLEELEVYGCSVTYRFDRGNAGVDNIFSAKVHPVSSDRSSLELSLSAQGAFVGIEVVMTELYGGTCEIYLLAGSSLLGEQIAFDDITFDRGKTYTVALRSVRWGRDGAVYGEERICIIRGGIVKYPD